MTLRHLRIFISVYQEMSITKASQKLHLAQPSVSLAIRELEEEYHIRLFDRINRKLAVTEKGIGFYEYAKHIVDLFDEMEGAMVSQERPGKLKLGSSITIGNFLVPDVIRQFGLQYPLCEVEVTIKNSAQIIRAVIKNELDLGLVEDKVSNEQLEEIPFMNDQLYFLCGKEHPLSMLKEISLDDLCTSPFYLREPGSASRDITDSFLKSYKLHPRIVWESVSNHALIQAVQSNPGITVLSGKLVAKEVSDGQLICLPIHPDAFSRSFYLIHHKKKYLPETMQSLLTLFRQNGDE